MDRHGGESYENALAENANGSHKNELIHVRSWNDVREVEILTFEWVTCWNTSRLHEIA
ncbi:integrase core domain-containing protein [Arcanobacterium haemolyticum]|uniref:integrase core domain-containing protein n=1 Tax=Arcanobacterium haemolyticum TaxID=28264 RepID=UPI000DE58C3B